MFFGCGNHWLPKDRKGDRVSPLCVSPMIYRYLLALIWAPDPIGCELDKLRGDTCDELINLCWLMIHVCRVMSSATKDGLT